MVTHERVSDNVYSFQSSTYAQVTAGVIAGPNWAVVIDTLAYPEETLAIRDFVEQELKVPVRYVINTHYHADHSWGNCFFPGAMIVSSKLCRDILIERGTPSLKNAQRQNPSIFRSVKIVPPYLTFERGNIGLRIGKKTLRVFSLPGHSVDGVGVLIEEDRVLFAGDILMAIPYIVDGNVQQMIDGLRQISAMRLENIVQGHGDIVLRGEIDHAVTNNIAYLNAIREVVHKASKERYPLDLLENADVESCGKSRVLINGLVEELHQQNLLALYKKLYGELPLGSEEYNDDYDDYEDDFEDE